MPQRKRSTISVDVTQRNGATFVIDLVPMHTNDAGDVMIQVLETPVLKASFERFCVQSLCVENKNKKLE